MGNRALLAWLFAISILSHKSAHSSSLDDHFDEIKTHGSVTALCKRKPDIDECKYAVGEWKPEELERIKNRSPFCINTCKHDFFGFVQTPAGDREYPVVLTKDFSALASSYGVEIKLLPLAVETYEYRACNGCNHIRTYPIALTAKFNEISIDLPLMGRGVFYLPTAFRSAALSPHTKKAKLILTMSDDRKVSANISGAAIKQYALMLKTLNFDRIKIANP